GLATGDNAKERRKHALIGAAAGGATGAGVGYYFDQQEAELRRALLNSGVQVQRVGENQLLLRMENGIGFSSSSYQLDASIHNTLRGVARILVEYPDTSLVIDGNGNSISYEKGRGVPDDQGELEAAFTGNHGWFFRNRNGKTVMVILKTNGDYAEMKRVL
ncbi:outer membrane protein, partial [Vibrio parahaemolyticus AQ3810]